MKTFFVTTLLILSMCSKAQSTDEKITIISTLEYKLDSLIPILNKPCTIPNVATIDLFSYFLSELLKIREHEELNILKLEDYIIEYNRSLLDFGMGFRPCAYKIPQMGYFFYK